jgi:hypothetical protein
MITKRGRKRKNEMYFGPEEEEAVVKFLDSRFIEVVDFKKGKPITIKHNLGENISIDVSYRIPNENAYGSDPKFIDKDVEVKATNYTKKTVEIETEVDVNGATVIIIDTISRDFIFK